MAPSFFSLFGGRRSGDGVDDVDAPATTDRPARPRPGTRVPRLEVPEQDESPEFFDDAPAVPAEDGAEDDGDHPRPTARRTASGAMSVRLGGAEAVATDEAEGTGALYLPGQEPAEQEQPEEESDEQAQQLAARTRAVDEAADRWREEIHALGSVSTLADMTLLGDAVLDLSHAHPGGVAALYAGRRTQLRNLIREPQALDEARHRARIVQAAAAELTQRFGIAPTFLAVGVATWALPAGRSLPGVASADHLARRGSGDGAASLAAQFALTDLAPHLTGDAEGGDGRGGATRSLGTLAHGRDAAQLQVPVLLRPVRLFPHGPGGQDVDLQIEPSVEINPVLVAALRERGVEVDLHALASTGVGGAGFAPRRSLEALAELAIPVLEGFELTEEIVVGTFLDPGQVVLDDLAAVRYRLPESDVLAAVAGDGPAREALLGAELPEAVAGDRPPEDERGAGDLDTVEQRALDAVAAGHSLLVDAPVGSHPARLAAAILADAAASGRRTVYLPASKRLGRATLDRLTSLGLEDVVLQLESETGWQARAAEQIRRSVAARESDLDVETLTTRREELTEVHGRLARYIDRVHAVRSPWDLSVYTIMEQLARLSAASPPPLTSVRLPAEVLRRLQTEGMGASRNALIRAAQLGAFSVGPEDTPWYGARVRTEDDAADALTRTRRLAEETLPRLRTHMQQASEQTGLTLPTTLAEWAEQLHVLAEVAESLDVFRPQIYERPVDQLVIATAPRAWRREHDEDMGATERRDLRRTAQDLVRPGSTVADLHAELLKVQQQRRLWERHSDEGGWPRLPEGLALMRQTEREVRADVDALADVLAPAEQPLTTLEIDRVHDLMTLLTQDAAALRDVPARASLVEELRAQGLGELIDDFALRKVTPAMVGPELDLAWWSGVFQDVVASDPALAGYDGPALGSLAERFRDLDLHHAASLAGPVRHAVISRLREAVYADTDEAAALYHSLGSDGGGHLRSTFDRWQELIWALRPVRAIAPMLAPQVLPAATDIDLLVIDHPRQLGMAQLAGVIARARQVVVLADTRAGTTAAAEELARVLPSLTLSTRRSAVSSQVMGFLAAHGYQDVAAVLPAPPGADRVRLDVLTGEGTTGTPAPGVDAVESPAAEVAHVVDLVAAHAAERAEESLGVVALSERHAVALRLALRRRARSDEALHRFLTAQRHERVVAIGSLDAAGLRRDRIILTLGYGKTVHGRVLHQFGPVSEPGGRAVLIEALAAVRRELHVVSCLAPGEIQSSRVNAPGTQLLAELLNGAGAGSLLPAPDPMRTDELPLAQVEEGADQLVVDLSERLWSLGVRVVSRYGVDAPGLPAQATAVRIPLAVGLPEDPDGLVLAVLTDDPDYVTEHSLRRRDRHELEALESRGWHVHRVFSAGMFLDLQRQAQEIADLARAAGASGAHAPAPGAHLSLVPPVGQDEGEAEEVSEVSAEGSLEDSPQEPEAELTEASGEESREVSREEPQDGAGSGEDQQPAQEPRGAGRTAAKKESIITRRAPSQRPTPLPRGPRPQVTKGLGLANYSDEDLDVMVTWILADALPRTEGQLITELRAHLDIRDTGQAARAVLMRAARRRS